MYCKVKATLLNHWVIVLNLALFKYSVKSKSTVVNSTQ